MSLGSNASAGSILETLNSTAPVILELLIGDWPRQDLLVCLDGSSGLTSA